MVLKLEETEGVVDRLATRGVYPPKSQVQLPPPPNSGPPFPSEMVVRGDPQEIC